MASCENGMIQLYKIKALIDNNESGFKGKSHKKTYVQFVKTAYLAKKQYDLAVW